MDQKLRHYAKGIYNKSKADDHPETTMANNSNPSKGKCPPKSKHGDRAERKPYGGDPAKVQQCHLSPQWPVQFRGCHKFQQDRALCSRLQRYWQRHFKRDCPKLKNKDGGNGNAQGWVYAVGNAEKRKCTREP
ncbi:hypothetical protein Tco_1467550 [Tanacetum coccineum]